MDILSVVGLGLVSAVLVVLLRQYKPEFAMPAGVLAAVVILLLSISASLPILDKIKETATKASINGDYIGILIKSLGVCYLTQFASDTCKDSGESSMASKIELAGKVAVMLLSLPLINQVLGVVTKLVG
ncbi:MAG: hypothetical protein BGN88_01755 [Clostridiales bacterium 43-6]|nr:MAG: hypothetical protein BGN88_01755 [Clostridiales bacterium 43-6]